nr:unnamed protein product [Callosobruchus analis]
MPRADWDLFASHLSALDTSESRNMTLEALTALINQAADLSIPLGGGKSGSRRVPWWNADISAKIKSKKHAFNVFKRHPTMDNLIEFKRKRAQARQAMLAAQRQSWRDYVPKLHLIPPFPKFGIK